MTSLIRHALAIVGVTVAISSAPAYAQQTPPFTAVITAEDVNVRAGRGENYYVVGSVAKGQIVQVKDYLYSWYGIEPLPGAYSFISKAYVKAEGDGTRGSIIGQRIRVRAPHPAGPDSSYFTQMMLDEGTPVKIAGEAGSYYKIAPPEGVLVYVHEKFLTKATPEQIAASGNRVAAATPAPAPAPAPSPAPAPAPPAVTTAETPTQPMPNPAPAPAPAPTETAEAPVPAPAPPPTAENPAAPLTTEAEPVKTTVKPTETAEAPAPAPAPEKLSGLAQLAELENKYLASVKLPLAEQPVTQLRLDYEKLMAAEDLSGADRNLIKARIELLASRQEVQASIKQINAVKQEMTAADKQRADEDAKKPKQYLAVGRLTASSLYSGEKLPLLYRLVDPLSGLTTAYIQPKPGSTVDPNSQLNQYVGIIGERQYDPALKLHIILTEQIDSLTKTQN